MALQGTNEPHTATKDSPQSGLGPLCSVVAPVMLAMFPVKGPSAALATPTAELPRPKIGTMMPATVERRYVSSSR